ncbi:MAG TPA: PfkB family carbohydrate kinase [Candidatus Limnocylindrales bacterium]|nr:PfkB family carbohydrate kinase [Candidatus Limnocylindrales bacterium]
MIVVAGESLIDLLVQPDGSVQAVPGGGPYNTARALARLGVPTAFVGRLSEDRFGRILRERLLEDGVDLRWSRATGDPTLLAIAEIDPSGGAVYRFHAAGSAAAELTTAALPETLPQDLSAIHVGTLGLVLEPLASAVETLIGRTPPEALRFVDLNVRPAAISDPAAYLARLERVVGRVHVVKASVDDLSWLDPEVAPEAAALRLLGMAAALVLVTDGPGPVRAISRSGIELVPVPVVAVVDTVGAGDVFGAGFLAAWTTAGLGIADLGDVPAVRAATQFASRVAAAVCARAGADPPTRDELDRLVPAS